MVEVHDRDRAWMVEFRDRFAEKVERALDDPLSDARLVALARADTQDAFTVGARLALWQAVGRNVPMTAFLEEAIEQLGLVEAVAAYVVSLSMKVVSASHLGALRAGDAIVAVDLPTSQGELWWFLFRLDLDLIDFLRRLLVATDEDTWMAAVSRLESFRTGFWRQRLTTTLLVPDRRDWLDADLRELPFEGRYDRADLLLYCGYDPYYFAHLTISSLSGVATAADALGDEVVAVLVRSLDNLQRAELGTDATVVRCLVDIGTDEALEPLIRRCSYRAVPAAVKRAALSRPDQVRHLLVRNVDAPYVRDLLAWHLVAFPDLADGAALFPDAVPELSRDQLPRLLAEPPWTRARSAPVHVPSVEIAPEIIWADGEQVEWVGTPWERFGPEHFDARRHDTSALGYQRVEFMLNGSEHLVRPLLADWRADEESLYFHDTKRVVGRFGVDAYRPMVRLARAKPAVGGSLLMPYLSTEVAELMANWLASSRQFRPLAQSWFDRHGARAVAALLPTALAGKGVLGRICTYAIARLDPDVVRAAGRQLDCAAATEALLARDPLDLIPAKVPKLPEWVDLAALPQILIRDRSGALDSAAVEVLCRMVMMSQLDPWPGLPVVLSELDRTSAAAFAAAIARAWHLAGEPTKDVWATVDVFAHLGDDDAAVAFARMVRAWPSMGGAARAKRGADALAIMDSERALTELSSIARGAKSLPLRKYAAAALDRVALDRGLLPEQLEDLLAPEAGLAAPEWEYQTTVYRAEIGPKRDLVLRHPNGRLISSLPKPATEADAETVAAWKKLRRAAGRDIADQTARLEQAMIVQRSWTADEFTRVIVGHPLLGALARRLVWRTDVGIGALDRLGDLIGIDGDLLVGATLVQLAHPAVDDLTRWHNRDVSANQPFEQLDRETFDGDPSGYWGNWVTAASLYALTRRGWHWGPSGRAATRQSLVRPLGPSGTVALAIEPGVSAVQDAAQEPDQRIESIALSSFAKADLAVFGDLSRVTRSELLRDFAMLVPATAP